MKNTKKEYFFYGHKVSPYAAEHGYVDYLTLDKAIGGSILCNNITKLFLDYEFELEQGGTADEYQYYIISNFGASVLQRYTDETLYYSEELDLWVWAVCHFGTGWDYVLTDIPLEDN